jgi:hypothetical protein
LNAGVVTASTFAPALLVAIVYLLLPAPLLSAPAPSVFLSIDTQSPGFEIPSGFAGLSFESGSEIPNRHGVSGHLFCATNAPLVTLFRNIGIHNLRLGGGSVDGLKAVAPSHHDIDDAFAFARAADLKVIYTLRLLNGKSTQAAETAGYIWQRYRSLLTAFAIGNEPDWRSYHFPPFGYGTDPTLTNYSSYRAAWISFSAAITNAAPGAVFIGPDTGSYTTFTYERDKSWTQLFAEDERADPRLTAITQHFYPGDNPGNTTALQAVDAMLSTNWLNSKYTWLYEHNLMAVLSNGLPYRLTESNDYLGGVTNASDAFASALWALDYMHWWAAHHCSGVNFHNKSWLLTDTVYLDRNGKYQIHPKAYGIKAFDLGSHGRTAPVSISMRELNPLAQPASQAGQTTEPVRPVNLTAYAVMNSSAVLVTIINKEHGANARDARITLAPNNIYTGKVSALFLTTPGHDPMATTGTLLGNAPITSTQPWQGKWTPLPTPGKNACSLTVPATSAAIIQIDL